VNTSRDERVAYLGEGSHISPLASIRGGERIRIGRNCRIDDFVVLSAGEGGIEIGDNVHVAVYVSMQGSGRITISDECQIAARCTILSSSGDLKYLGESGSPTMPGEREKAISGDVTLDRGAILGVGAVVMPYACIGEQTVVGVLSLVRKASVLERYSIYAGNPLRRIGDRVARPA
jgi:acetyltransferase-like isoleucine patch superfamily enzyme